MEQTTGEEGRRPARPSPPARAPWRAIVRWTVLVVLTVGLCALLVTRVDWPAFAAAMKLARVWMIAVAGAVAVSLCMWGCIERLWTLLGPLPHGGSPVSRLELASIHYASSAAHNLLPAPAGEVVRTVQLRRRNGYPVGVLIAAQLVEKVIEAVGLGLEVLVVTLLSPLPRAVGVSLELIAGLGAGGALVAVVLAWRWKARHAGEPDEPAAPADQGPHARGEAWSLPALRSHARAFARRLGEGLYLVRSPRVWAAALFWSCVADLANAATVGLVLAALGLHLPIAAWFLVMLAARMAGLFPSTPGQFGVQEAAVVLVLKLLGVDETRAFAVAILHHVAHFVPVTLAGLWELRRQWSLTAQEARAA